MTIDEIRKLFQGLQDRLSISRDVEVTLEANPGKIEVEKFAQL
jgi:oxygen-independent coproporphyrinogen-3 oxidase